MEEMSDLKTQMKNLNQTHKAEVENLQNQITALQNKPYSITLSKTSTRKFAVSEIMNCMLKEHQGFSLVLVKSNRPHVFSVGFHAQVSTTYSALADGQTMIFSEELYDSGNRSCLTSF